VTIQHWVNPEEDLEVEIEGAEEQTEQDLDQESETETEGSEGEGVANEGDDLSEDERKHFGKRAQKRIRKLLGATKAKETEIAELRRQLQEAQAERTRTSDQTVQAQETALQSHEASLEARRKGALAAIKAARDADDFEAESGAIEELTKVQAEALMVQAYKKQIEARRKPATEERPVDRAEERQEVDPEQYERAIDWQVRNPWYQGPSAQDRAKTLYAVAVHNRLLKEGINPAEDADEYYEELDRRLVAKFPELKRGSKTVRKASPVSGPARSGVTAKRKVSLSESELRVARRMGLTPEQYAKEKARLDGGSA